MPVKIYSSNQPHQGLIDKISLIRSYYPQALTKSFVRRFAEDANIGEDGKRSLNVLFNELRSHLKYFPDPVKQEYIKAPWVMIQEISERGWAAGDCDDFASLTYTILKELGYNSGLRVGWKEGHADPSHIWNFVQNRNGDRIDFDLTTPKIGMAHPDMSKVQDFR